MPGAVHKQQHQAFQASVVSSNCEQSSVLKLAIQNASQLEFVRPAGPGAYTPKTPESSHKKHRTPDVLNPSAAGAIAALQAKLRSTRRAATGEAHQVDEVLRATLKFGAVQASHIVPTCMLAECRKLLFVIQPDQALAVKRLLGTAIVLEKVAQYR